MLPSDGPVKVANKLGEDGRGDEIAEQLEDDLNYYLTTIATEYYPDADRMLLMTGMGGDGFKRSIIARSVAGLSLSVDAKDLIISDAATDIRNAGRPDPSSPCARARCGACGIKAYRNIADPDPGRRGAQSGGSRDRLATGR